MNQVTVMPWAMKKRKFYCCTCGEKLILYPSTRTVRRGDPDYNEHRSFGRHRLIGDIELTEYDFKCMSCDRLIPYDEQCMIEQIQKYVGTHILTPENISEHSEKAKTALEKKRRIRRVFGRLLGAILTVLALFYMIKTGRISFRL